MRKNELKVYHSSKPKQHFFGFQETPYAWPFVTEIYENFKFKFSKE